MSPEHLTPEEEPVCTAWPRLVQTALVLFLVVTAAIVARYWVTPNSSANSEDMQQQISRLSAQVDELQQEQAMPAQVLNRYRNSICYILGIYQVGFPGQKPLQRTRISGTGFVVADGLIATNRHVAEPWYGDPDTDALVARGATPRLEKLVAYFPGSPAPVTLAQAALSSDGDLAIVRMSNAPFQPQPLPLATTPPNPGELVA